MKYFPIVFTCDDKYFKYTSVVISSIVSNSNANFNYKIYIVSEGISIKNQSLILKYIRKYTNFVIEFINIENFNAHGFYLNSYMTASTYYRFYIPQLFKQYHRILHLDSDIIVDADISELMEMDFDNKLAIAVHDSYIYKLVKNDDKSFSKEYFTTKLQMNDPKEYFNAGVVLYNLKKINDLNLTNNFFQVMEKIKYPIMQDQDILNSSLSNRGGVKLISNKYNFMYRFHFTYKNLFITRLKHIFGIKIKKTFYIYHFVGKYKPWNSNVRDTLFFYKYLYSIHLATPPKEFVNEIHTENNKKLHILKRLFLKYLS